MSDGSNPWGKDESKYIAYLEHERHMFAWCLVTHGEQSQAEARDAALSFYVYEQSTDPYRGLIFHDEAWHWAMLRIFGEGYWLAHCELEQPSTAYWAESEAFAPTLGA